MNLTSKVRGRGTKMALDHLKFQIPITSVVPEDIILKKSKVTQNLKQLILPPFLKQSIKRSINVSAVIFFIGPDILDRLT